MANERSIPDEIKDILIEPIDTIIARYDGDTITCYPGSNQTDEGKLNIESNMSRFVTRVTSKNFCIVKPSYEIEPTTDIETGKPLLRILKGQCSINGMDLIMQDSLTIEPPQQPGRYHLAFRLARDSSNNVLGDFRMTSTWRRFEGVYLAYYDNKPDPVHPDMFYLGQVTWDGNEFSDIVEDEDKYGRIWAEDILCKLLDPKHPDISRINLQEYIYKLPDWYFSKEGDIIYGPLTIADNRENNNPGILMNVDENGSHITVKDPTQDNEKLQFYGDLNRDGVIDQADVDLVQQYLDGTKQLSPLQLKLADVNHDGEVNEKDLEYILNFINNEVKKPKGDTGNIYYIDNSTKGLSIDSGNGKTELGLEKGKIYQDQSDDILHIHNDGGICVDAEGPVTVQGDGSILLSTENTNSPQLKLDDNNFSVLTPKSDLKFNITFPNSDSIQQTVGKAIWQYTKSNKIISLLQTDVNYLQVSPNSDFINKLRVRDTIYIGNETTYGSEKTFLKTAQWRLGLGNNYIDFTPTIADIVNGSNGISLLKMRNNTDTVHSILKSNGSLELLNGTAGSPASIDFKDGNASYDISIKKIIGSKKLNINGHLQVDQSIEAVNGSVTGKGLITSNGILTFRRGSNDATITKDNNTSALRTNGDLYIGSTGASKLFAGNTVIKGTFTQGSSGQLTMDTNGNINTSGTIRGSKVYNAVYNRIW